MRILIEEYQYSVTDEKRRNDLKVILQELGGFENLERKVSVNCVGYYYSTQLKDCVFILPKVLITVTKDKRELVFGEYQPEDIINIDSNTLLSDQQKRFIYEFAVWIYRAIDVYRTKNSKSQIIYYRHIAKVGNGITETGSSSRKSEPRYMSPVTLVRCDPFCISKQPKSVKNTSISTFSLKILAQYK